jgi:uncharacterized protein (TIGR03437 family)
MKRFTSGIALLLCVTLLDARQEKQTCGTHPDTWREEIHLHRQAKRSAVKRLSRSEAVRAALPDIGNLAVLDETDGVVARRNPFNLNKQTVRFVPDGTRTKYRFEVAADSYDAVTAENGTLVSGLKDDDTAVMTLPFPFPFWGRSYSSIFVNSDGNLTFDAGDLAVTNRSLGRFTSGQPRIAALFRDLDPSKALNGVRVTSDANRFVVSWIDVPEYQDFGTGALQTFQVRLYPDGKIELAYSEIETSDAIAGISPGGKPGGTTMVSFSGGQSSEYTSSFAERFSGLEEIDIFTAAQKFYLNHEDAYDYLVIYNTLGVSAGDGAVAFETTLRNNRSGYGDERVEIGQEAGSGRRLQAIINMGPLNQYPKDPFERVQARFSAGDTPLTVLGHEAGHLFLAFASVRDENDPNARPMLGRQIAHWDFKFNSEASLLEGNRIQDNGPNASPRFVTSGTVEGYAPLDQYLMGFRPPNEVPDTFLVVNPRATNATGSPRIGVAFDGTRRDIRIDEIIQVEGRRIPDHTVSQRKFRFAFVVVTANGTAPSAEEVAQIESYRREFETFFAKAASGNATAETGLKRSLRVSTFPAAGVIEGATATGSVAIEQPAAAPLTVLLRSSSGAIQVGPSVIIPAGATQAGFTFRGQRQGTDDLIAEPADPQFETVQSRIQVSPAAAVTPSVAAGDFQTAKAGSPLASPVRFRVLDANELPYPGVPVQVAITGGGSVDRTTAMTDETGTASFMWSPGSASLNELRAVVPGGAAVIATALSKPVFASTSVVNAASYSAGLVSGGIATIFGANLSSSLAAEVLVNGEAAQIFYASPRQLNFFLPLNTPPGTAELSVRTTAGASDAVRVPVTAISPGIFFDTASGFGAVLVSGTAQVTQQRPVAAGEIIEIYVTGMGAVQEQPNGLRTTTANPQVTIGGRPADVLFSGLAPGFPGLYQVNARVPSGLAGVQPLKLIVGTSTSNEVKVQLRF